jgi:hypothetical protein
MSFFSRFKPAAKILLLGEPKKKTRNPIPPITAEEVAERGFFFRERSFLSSVMPDQEQRFSRALPACIPKCIAIIRHIFSRASHCLNH